MLQYEGYTGFSDRSAQYRSVTSKMARKSIKDAARAGIQFLRVSISGFGGIDPIGAGRDMLLLWQKDPETFWARVNGMFDDLDAEGVQIVPTLFWNIAQFPALTGETTGDFIRNPQSKSRLLAVRFMTDFVERYKARQTILFHELTNEFNLNADLDKHQRCVEARQDPSLCVSVSNFTTGELNDFAREMVEILHTLDPSRNVSSGYSFPQPWAFHMQLQPEWTGHPGFVKDTYQQFATYLTSIHVPFDIISIHVYPTNAILFNRGPSTQIESIKDAIRVAHQSRKPLFLGEFGDSGATPFMLEVANLLAGPDVDFASVWIWEFHQTSTFRTRDTEPTRYSIEPGLGDDVIALLKRLASPRQRSKTPTVVLTWPLPCAKVENLVSISAVAADGDVGPVQRVEFSVDGKSIGSVNAFPYTLPWTFNFSAAKLLTLTATAYGRDGIATDQVTLVGGGTPQKCTVTE